MYNHPKPAPRVVPEREVRWLMNSVEFGAKLRNASDNDLRHMRDVHEGIDTFASAVIAAACRTVLDERNEFGP